MLGASILSKSCRRFSPGRVWLNTARAEAPETFDAAVRAVWTADAAAEARHAAGSHTVSIDEQTGSRALERVHPALPLRPGRIERLEFEGAHHGTQCLITNVEVATGQVIIPTVGPTHTEADVAAHVAQAIAPDPTAEWILSMDQLNTHQ